MATAEDKPGALMGLGSHLDELRRRLIYSMVLTFVLMLAGFLFQFELIKLIEQPLVQASSAISDETLHDIGHTSRFELRQFHNLGVVEGPMNVLKLSLFAAIVAGFPFLVYQIWSFVVPGLKPSERSIGFLMVPAGIIFFYGGLTLGFTFGLPFILQMLFEFNATFQPGVKLLLTQNLFYSFVFLMCIVFGAIMDIPWLILVLVRARVVTPDQIAKARRYIFLVAAVASAILSPPDPVSQVVLLGMIVVLFEAGLLASRVMIRRKLAAAADGDADGDGEVGPGRNKEDGLIGHLVDLPTDPAGAPAPTAQTDEVAAADDEDDADAFIDEDEDGSVPEDFPEGDAEEIAEAPATPPAGDPWAVGRKRKESLIEDEESEVSEDSAEKDTAAEDDEDDPWAGGRARDEDTP